MISIRVGPRRSILPTRGSVSGLGNVRTPLSAVENRFEKALEFCEKSLAIAVQKVTTTPDVWKPWEQCHCFQSVIVHSPRRPVVAAPQHRATTGRCMQQTTRTLALGSLAPYDATAPGGFSPWRIWWGVRGSAGAAGKSQILEICGRTGFEPVRLKTKLEPLDCQPETYRL